MSNIVIIEDNVEYARLLANYLKQLFDFDVVAVYNRATDALEELHYQTVNIVIIDIGLPDMSGVELIRKLKMLCNNMKYLVLTLHGDDDTILRAFHAGANGYLLKDAPPEKIADALREMANGGAPMSSFVCSALLNQFQTQQKRTDQQNGLSSREKEVLQHISRGLLYKEIAANLGIERETVKKHLSKIYTKLKVQNKIEALNKYFGQ